MSYSYEKARKFNKTAEADIGFLGFDEHSDWTNYRGGDYDTSWFGYCAYRAVCAYRFSYLCNISCGVCDPENFNLRSSTGSRW